MIFVKIANAGKFIKGYNDVTDKEYSKDKNWIRAYTYAFEGEVVLSKLGGQGAHQVSGREYQRVIFTHLLSSASVSLFKTLVENTSLEIDVHLTRSARAGGSTQEMAYTKYKFKGAKISHVKHTAVEQGGQAYLEEVGFKFNQIIFSADDDTTGEKPEAEDNITVA
jgi:type VI protein secretion system component Hcp